MTELEQIRGNAMLQEVTEQRALLGNRAANLAAQLAEQIAENESLRKRLSEAEAKAGEPKP